MNAFTICRLRGPAVAVDGVWFDSANQMWLGSQHFEHSWRDRTGCHVLTSGNVSVRVHRRFENLASIVLKDSRLAQKEIA
ncbi:MAG: hypothetical protein WD795_16425 [Woeseia sp.]